MSGTVGVRELRHDLSALLRQVQRGERLIVTDRNRPVAELVPLSAQADVLGRLVAQGKVVAPQRPLDLKPVPLRGAGNPASASLGYVRGERR
jgi:prevent-host-death family protein